MSTTRVVGLCPELRDLFCSTASPRQRLAVARPTLDLSNGLLSGLEPALRAQASHAFLVQQAARLDGYEVRATQQAWGLFNPTRKVELTQWAFNQFEAESVARRIEEAVSRLAEVTQLPEVVHVGLFAADPANYNLMVHCGGVSISGEGPDSVLIQLWPDPGNLARLEALVWRCLLMGVLSSRRAPTTVADFLRREGEITEILVEHGMLPPAWQPCPWGLAQFSPPGHQAVLDEIASHYGLKRYGEMQTNVYGNLLGSEDFATAGRHGSSSGGANQRGPQEHRLSADDLAYTRSVLLDQTLLAETNAAVIAAVLYGDEAVRRYGLNGVGLSPWAGLQLSYEDQRFRSGSTG